MATATGDRYERALALYEGGDFQACRELVLEELSERPRTPRCCASRAGRARSSTSTTQRATCSRRSRSSRTTPTHGATSRRRTSPQPPHGCDGGDPASGRAPAGRIRRARRPRATRVRGRPPRRGDRRARTRPSNASRGTWRRGARSSTSTARQARIEEALEAAEQLLQLEPDDVLAALDVAELSLALGRLDDAVDGVLAPAGDRRRPRARGVRLPRDDRGRDASATAGAARSTSPSTRRGSTATGARPTCSPSSSPRSSARPTAPPRPRAEVDEALAASQAEHRRLHAEAVVF